MKGNPFHHIRTCCSLLALLVCLLLGGCNGGAHPDYLKAYNYSRQYKLFQLAEKEGGLAQATRIAYDSLRHPKARTLLRQGLEAYYFYRHGQRDRWKLSIDSSIALIEGEQLRPVLHGWLTVLYTVRAVYFYDHGMYEATLADLHEASQLAGQYNNAIAQNEIDYYMGMVSFNERRFDQAARHFQSALKTATLAKPDLIPRACYESELLDNIGLCFYQLAQEDSALHYYRQTVAYLKRHEHSMGDSPEANSNLFNNHMANVMENIGNVSRMANRPGESLDAYRQALQYVHRASIPDTLLMSRLHTRIGWQKLLLGRPAEAKLHLDSSLRYGAATGSNLPEQLRLQAGLEWNPAVGYHPAALLYQRQLDSVERSRHLQQVRTTQADIGNALRLQEQRYTITGLRDQETAHRQMMWAMGICIGLLGLATAVVYRQYSRNTRLLASEQALNRQVGSQKQALELAAIEKEKLLRVVAHDLRSPLNGITSSMQLMRHDLNMDEENAHLYQLCIDSGFKCLNLINELVQSQGGMPETATNQVLLNQVVNDTVTLLRHKARQKGLHLHSVVGGASLWASVYSHQLSRVLENLVHNSIKFSNPGGQITVTLFEQGSQAVLQVSDQGIGMTRRQLAQLFTTGSNGQLGTSGEQSYGLGMGICQQLVRAMDGIISAESQPGMGTTIEVRIPLARLAPAFGSDLPVEMPVQ